MGQLGGHAFQFDTKQPFLEASERPVALAYAAPAEEKRKNASRSLKVILVALDCCFLGLQPVLVHMSKNSAGGYSFAPVAVNLLIELAKTAFALITLIILGTGRPGTPMYRSIRSFIHDAHHNRLLAVPALLYAVNNYLKFTMQLFFKPTTTKMLGNLKIFTIALLMRTVMRRKFNVIQWEALFLLVAGITVNQLSKSCPGAVKDAADHPPLLMAALCTLGTVTVPSAASVYNEFALKKHMDTSVHLQNFFLYFYGLVFNMMAVLTVSVVKGQTVASMFNGQSWVTIFLIANNAAQGILASFFYKYADTILKKYSSTIATIFTAIMSFVMFGHELTVNFMLGVSIVFVSMHQFFTYGDKSHLEREKSHSKATRPTVNGMNFSPSLAHIAEAVSDVAKPVNGAAYAAVAKAEPPMAPSHSVGITIGRSSSGGNSWPTPGLYTTTSLQTRGYTTSSDGTAVATTGITPRATATDNHRRGVQLR